MNRDLRAFEEIRLKLKAVYRSIMLLRGFALKQAKHNRERGNIEMATKWDEWVAGVNPGLSTLRLGQSRALLVKKYLEGRATEDEVREVLGESWSLRKTWALNIIRGCEIDFF